MKRDRTITEWITYFMNDFFPHVTKQECDMVERFLGWDDEKKAAFFLAKGLFEAKDEDTPAEQEEAQPKRRKALGK